MKVLLIEDNNADMILIDTFLQEFMKDYELVVMEDGQKATNYISNFDHYSEDVPKLVILDLNLPKISGIKVYKEQQTSEKNFCSCLFIFHK